MWPIRPSLSQPCWSWRVLMGFVPMRPSSWRQPVFLRPNCLMGWSVAFLDGVLLRTVSLIFQTVWMKMNYKNHYSYIQMVWHFHWMLDHIDYIPVKWIWCCIWSNVLVAAQQGSNHLLEANVLLIKQETCAGPKIYDKIMDASMFCAGHLQGGVDSCQVSEPTILNIYKYLNEFISPCDIYMLT